MIAELKPTVVIIVLTWNQRDLTLACLESLKGMDYPQDRLEVIVVDNGSGDGTAEAVRAQYPLVVLLENKDNLGFAEGNNVGLRHALRGDAEYIMLLNNDTVVDRDLLRHLLQLMETNETVGIAGPKMLYYDAPDIVWNAGNHIDWRLGGIQRIQGDQRDGEVSEQPQEVDFITACAILLRRQVINQIGLLDPRFFMYFDETDWCTRARKAGWRILYVPKARIWHKVSATIGVTSPAIDYYMTRNVLLFLVKNRTGIWRALSPLLAFGRHLLAVLAYTLNSHHGQRIPNRNARLLALRDALLGCWGKMGDDVAQVCYPKRQ